MLLRIIKYIDLDTFFDQIKDKENFTHLQLEMGPKINFTSAQCANDVEKILGYLKVNDYSNIEMIFLTHIINVDIKPIVLAFAKMLSQGNYPKRLIINLGDNTFNSECIIPLAHALESGHCYNPLTIKLRYVNSIAIKAFANALMSGKCYRGLHLDISENLQIESMLNIMRALRHKNCPEDLSLSIACSFYSTGVHGAIFISEALQHGEMPKGLTIKIYGNGSEHAHYLIPAFDSDKLPLNLTIKLVDLQRECAAKLAQALEKALQENTLSLGFNINLSYINHLPLHYKYKRNIDGILRKNAIKHAALTCAALWQGNRQDESSLSALPEELIKDIQTYTFFNSALPFFNANQHEELVRKEKVFSKNVEKTIKKYG